MNFGPQIASNSTCILHTLCKFRIPLDCQASQTKISKWNSTTLCQSVNKAVEKLGSSLPKKLGAKQLLHLFGFSTTSTLNGEYLLNETRNRQSGKGIGKCEGSPTLSHNFTNFGLQTAQNRTGGITHPHYFVLSQSIAHPLCGINVTPHSDSR